ncbi:hypothetical protein SAMN05444156_1144 [Verrucomicrobium sp. GAS474]|uniref:hypothetical protein n=1 Tax=Verrucomicrobium sp. GAS474 TaxID=1882831 RepID=UPI00087CC870|nr:hypothetical protein [Verrucomicrobium sp. GAS474]SDT96898.1 hypothetical protein SAMN05444156_1144 [Verrucomicrobium sp. GAS474]
MKIHALSPFIVLGLLSALFPGSGHAETAPPSPQALLEQAVADFPPDSAYHMGPFGGNFRLAAPPEKKNIDGIGTAWRADYVQTLLAPKNVSQRATPIPDPASLNEAQRHEAFDQTDNHVILWIVPDSTLSDAKKIETALPPGGPCAAPIETALIGQKKGYVWYAQAPASVWITLQQKGFENGDDPFAAAVHDVIFSRESDYRYAGRFRSLSFQFLEESGIKAFPALRDMAEKQRDKIGENDLYWLFSIAGKIPKPEVTAWLLEKARSDDPAIARHALGGLLGVLRPEAEPLYLDALRRGEPAQGFLYGLRALASSHLAEAYSLVRVRNLNKPTALQDNTFSDYREAVLGPKADKGWTNPPELAGAEKAIREGLAEKNTEKIEQGRTAVLAWPDGDAAQLTALNLIIAIGKGNFQGREQQRLGYAILSELRVRNGETAVSLPPELAPKQP